jgi:hypothetical protein
MMITSNVTQDTSTVTSGGITTSTITLTFTNGDPSVHEAVTDSTTEKIMIFKTADVNHTFTVPAGGLNCDVLMIGGGGGDSGGWAGGGAGACIVSINQNLPAGTCIVYVGGGGSGNGSGGGDSFIRVENADRYRAKGGGSTISGYSFTGPDGGCGSGASYHDGESSTAISNGGLAVSTNVVTLNGNDGTTQTSPTVNNNNRFAVMGNDGGKNVNTNGRGGGGGGGIGTPGTATPSSPSNAAGGNGKFNVYIDGTTYNFRNYFANSGNNFGVQDGSTGNYYIGGGGSAFNGGSGGLGGLGGGGGYSSGTISPIPNTGSGGSGGRGGATGIVIIRYRSQITTNTTTSTTTYTHTPTITTTLSTPTLGTPSIELVRGTQGDSNRDYKIGNYEGDFIVKSSINGIDNDYIRLQGTNGAIFNFTNSLYWTQTSDRRIKENITRASYDMCYDNINKLELNRFNYIKEFNTGNKDTNQLGFIAQEIKEIFPKAVFTNDYNKGDLSIPDMLSIDIGQINYSLYGTVKKLMDINKDNEMRLKRLECLLNVESDSDGSGSGGDGSGSGSGSGDNVVIDSDVSIDTSNILETSNITIDTSNIVIDTSNIVIDTSNIILDTSNIILDTSNI